MQIPDRTELIDLTMKLPFHDNCRIKLTLQRTFL